MRSTVPMTLLPLVLLLACSPDGPEADAAALVDQAPAVRRLTLPPTPFVLGASQQLVVRGATPGDTVGVLAGVFSGGTTPTCFANPAICLDLPGPPGALVLLGTATADANGDATLTIAVPPGAPRQPVAIQAAADPFGSPYYSPAQVVRFVQGGDDEDGDGLSNADELTLGTDLEDPDTDGGGAPDGLEVSLGTDPFDPSDDVIDLDGDGFEEGVDCDDGDPAINPGAAEVCDGADNDCDGVIDPDDAWWDTGWSYRIPVTVTAGPAWLQSSPPVAVDVDFAAALADAADASGLDPASIRVVRQGCSLGQPEVPSEFLDDLAGILDATPSDDPTGDDAGAVVFLADRDGNYATRENLNAGASAAYAIYFNSNATTNGAAASYPSTISVSTSGTVTSMSNALTYATFDTTKGGVADTMGATGRPSTGSQTTTSLGNGIYLGDATGGAWVGAREDTAATTEVLHVGPVLGVVRSSGAVGNAYGGFDYEYTYFLFEGRKEVYTKVVFELNQSSAIRQSPFWGAGVRPYFVNNNTLAAAAASEGAGDIPGFNWVRGTYAVGGASPYGIAAGYRESVALRSRPVFDATGTANAGRYVGLAGQDIEPVYSATTPQYVGAAGERPVDHAVLSVFPHAGLFGSVSVDFYATLEGVTATQGAVELP